MSLDLSPGYGVARFAEVLTRDRGADAATTDPLARWLLTEPQPDHDLGEDPGVTGYDGPRHLLRWFAWAAPFRFPDTFLADDDELIATSAARDAACLERLGVEVGDVDLRHVGRYNAQDAWLLRDALGPTPPRVLLDLGPGHGRLANLATRPGAASDVVVAVEGIAGPYLTQRAYYDGLGLRVADYLDADAPGAFDVAAAAATHDVVHLPTWRLDLVPDASVDLVCAVQVLKELPPATVEFVLGQLRRVVRPGGALYVRDHLEGHDLTGLPVDELVEAHGFTPTYAPEVRDRVELHGVPRVWRRRSGDAGSYGHHDARQEVG